MSCFTSGSRRVTLFTNFMIDRDRLLLTLNKWGKYNIAWLTVTVQLLGSKTPLI